LGVVPAATPVAAAFEGGMDIIKGLAVNVERVAGDGGRDDLDVGAPIRDPRTSVASDVSPLNHDRSILNRDPIPKAAIPFRFFIGDDGALDRRVRVDDGDTCPLVLLDEAGADARVRARAYVEVILDGDAQSEPSVHGLGGSDHRRLDLGMRTRDEHAHIMVLL